MGNVSVSTFLILRAGVSADCKDEEKSAKDTEKKHPVWENKNHHGIVLESEQRASFQLKEKVIKSVQYWS